MDTYSHSLSLTTFAWAVGRVRRGPGAGTVGDDITFRVLSLHPRIFFQRMPLWFCLMGNPAYLVIIPLSYKHCFFCFNSNQTEFWITNISKAIKILHKMQCSEEIWIYCHWHMHMRFAFFFYNTESFSYWWYFKITQYIYSICPQFLFLNMILCFMLQSWKIADVCIMYRVVS